VYYPAIVVTDFQYKQFTQSESQIVVTVDGTNIVNGPHLTCMLGDSATAFNIYFISSTQIICSFDMVDSGMFALSVSNNGVQFVSASDLLEVIDSVQILLLSPKLVLSRSLGTVIAVYATNLFNGCQCLFEVASPYTSTEPSRDIVAGQLIDDQMLLCSVPDYSNLGSVYVNVRIAYSGSLKVRLVIGFMGVLEIKQLSGPAEDN